MFAPTTLLITVTLPYVSSRIAEVRSQKRVDRVVDSHYESREVDDLYRLLQHLLGGLTSWVDPLSFAFPVKSVPVMISVTHISERGVCCPVNHPEDPFEELVQPF